MTRRATPHSAAAASLDEKRMRWVLDYAAQRPRE
jgi:hypothetical protein